MQVKASTSGICCFNTVERVVKCLVWLYQTGLYGMWQTDVFYTFTLIYHILVSYEWCHLKLYSCTPKCPLYMFNMINILDIAYLYIFTLLFALRLIWMHRALCQDQSTVEQPRLRPAGRCVGIKGVCPYRSVHRSFLMRVKPLCTSKKSIFILNPGTNSWQPAFQSVTKTTSEEEITPTMLPRHQRGWNILCKLNEDLWF